MAKSTTTATPKAPRKTSTSKASAPAPVSSRELTHATEPTREPVWSPKRMAIVKAMRTLGAVSPDTARLNAEICPVASKQSKLPLAEIEAFICAAFDKSRVNELIHNGFVADTRYEGERRFRYYLTKKGVKTTFPQPATE